MLSSVIGSHDEMTLGEALRTHFECTWFHTFPEGGGGSIAVVPDGSIDLQWLDGVLRIAGPDRTVNCEAIRPGATVIGFRFRPGAASRWLGVSAHEVVDARVPLDLFWGDGARRLAEWAAAATTPIGVARRIEEALVRRARDVDVSDPFAIVVRRSIESVLATSDQTEFIRDLCTELRVSERTLRRRCHEAFGYGPKTLQRILRFQHFLRLARRGNDGIGGLAAEAGYADQAHLTREAREMSALTPRALLAQLA